MLKVARSHLAHEVPSHLSWSWKPPTAEAETPAHVQLFVLLLVLIGTDAVEVAGGEFITLCMKAAAQIGTDLPSKCLALMCLVIFC